MQICGERRNQKSEIRSTQYSGTQNGRVKGKGKKGEREELCVVCCENPVVGCELQAAS